MISHSTTILISVVYLLVVGFHCHSVPMIVFSRQICELAEKYNALVFLDECHATGFLGKMGR